ncbi:MAG: fatty acid-binding protein DegV [Candidatus Marinamargulisbacteria bacterium]|jgi:fatty acid-binding protein DegV
MQPPALPERPGGPGSEKLIQNLKSLKMLNNTKSKDLQNVSKFLEVKSKGSLKEQLSAIRTNSPKTLGGEDNWIVGLIGMAYGSHNGEPALVASIVSALAPYMSNGNEFFVVSIMRSFLDRVDIFNKEATQTFVKTVLTDEAFLEQFAGNKLDWFTKDQLINMTSSILKSLGKLEARQEFLGKVSQHHLEETGQKLLNPNQKSLFEERPQIETLRPDSFYDKQVVATKEMYAASLIASLIAHGLLSPTLLPILSSSPSLIYSLINVLDLERHIYNIRAQRDLTRVAILTDHAMLPGFVDNAHIHVIEGDPIYPIRTFFNEYRKLISRGYTTIYVMVPESRYWTSFFYAKQAAIKMEHCIKVISSKTYGLGLGVFIHEIGKLIFEEEASDRIEETIRAVQKNLRYWVILDRYDKVASTYWFKKMVEVQQQDEKLHEDKNPVLAFHGQMGVFGETTSLKKSIDLVEKRIDHICKERGFPPKRIVIVYGDFYAEALLLASDIAQKYTGMDISVVPAGRFLMAQFGSHVSVCMI